VAARPRQRGRQTAANRVRHRSHDGDRRGDLLCGAGGASHRDNDADLEPDELVCDCRETFTAPLSPAILYRNGTALHPAEFPEPVHKGGGPASPVRCGTGPQEADSRHFALLLRARREWPRRRHAAEQRDERAPLHSITSSASAISLSGISRPSAFAALRLITNSNFVDC